MNRLLLIAAAPIAALALFPAPAAAQWSGGPKVHRMPSDRDSRAVFAGDSGRLNCDLRADPGFRVRGGRDGDRRHRRAVRSVCDVSVGLLYEGGEWALYNNRSWESDSYNDWWHDRPDRAYPRWMQNNQNCDRMWWGGGVWRCSW